MTYDPLSDVIDEQLSTSPEAVHQLEAFRVSEKFTALPGTDTAVEQVRLSEAFNELLDRLIAEVLSNPSKLWVMRQFQPSLDAVGMEDTQPTGQKLRFYPSAELARYAPSRQRRLSPPL